MKLSLCSLLLAASLYAADSISLTPMGLACDGFGGFPCSKTEDGGFLAYARSKAPVVLFELTYEDATGKHQVRRQAIVNDAPGQLVFAAFRVGMYRTNVSAGTKAISLRVIDLMPADESEVH